MLSKWISAAIVLLALADAQEYSPAKGKGQVNAYPILGFGSFGVGGYSEGKANNPAILNMTRDVVKRALLKGYRLVDTATVYGNERGVGMGIAEALKDRGLNREDFWVSTKLWGDSHNDPEAGLKISLQNLGLSYVDLYLMHYPFGLQTGTFDHVETWKKMQNLVRPNGPVRFIGVSNFSPDQMNDIMQLPGVKPKVHQFELHPYLQQPKFVQWHIDNKVAIAGYAPLANTSPSYRNNYNRSIPLITNNPVLKAIKNARGCASEAQVALKWNIQRGAAVVVKASRGEHQDENLETEKCKLTNEDMERIAKFRSEEKWVARMNNPCVQYSVPCFKGLEEEKGGGILWAFDEHLDPVTKLA